MPAATQVFTNFLGGEISEYAQGRYDREDYRKSMRVCLNSFPVEAGAWTRRPGTRYAGHTKAGAPGREIKFDFEQFSPVTMEFIDGTLRFRNGAVLITTNDAVGVVSVSAANPVVLQVSSVVAWQTGSTIILPGASTPLLENRQFIVTAIDATHFSIADALTGAPINGSTLGAIAAGATVERVHELSTVYVNGAWSQLRAVQAETSSILLQGQFAPQILTVASLPGDGVNPTFEIDAAIFQDGPYLDPLTNGVQAVPTAKTGIITLQLQFPTYDSTKAYADGSYVTNSGVNYVSLADQNVNHTPASSPAWWQSTSAGAAINDGRGFLGTDIGRLVRLFSEPILWKATDSYGQGGIVSYNPTGIPGAATYWQAISLAPPVGAPPGTDLTNWQIIPQGAAIWTWGRITGLSNVVDRTLGTAIGSLSGGGGVAAAFDGLFSQNANQCAHQETTGGYAPGLTVFTMTGYVGKNFTAGGQQIHHAVVYPSVNLGLVSGTFTPPSGSSLDFPTAVTLNLRGKNSAPASSSDGVLLGSTGVIANVTNAVSIVSSDQSNSYQYVWIEIISTYTVNVSTGAISYFYQQSIAEVSLFNSTGVGTGQGAQMEILGPALLYTQPILTWRLGAFSDTTGYPTCGVWDGGRLWLGGAIANRWDASYVNGITGITVNFAPTDQYGTVSDANAISYTFNSDGVNKINWMMPDLQGVLMGTQAGEWLVRAPTSGPITPTNVDARRVTKIGSGSVEPRRTDHTIVFPQRYGRKIMEYFPDVYSGKFSAPNLSDKAQHIPRTGVLEIAYVEAVNPIIWGRCTDGSLFGITYRRDNLSSAQGPTHYAWHPHALGSGRVVESMCSGPSTGGDLDTLTIITNDTVSGIRHVEVLTDTPDELTTLANGWFLDDAVNPTSTSYTTSASAGAPRGGATFNGLWHLNGQTVQVFAAGLDCGDRGDKTTTDYVVSNGSVFVPFGDGVNSGPGQGLFTVELFFTIDLSQVVIGFTYDSDGQLVRLIAQADTGARNGPALGAPSRTHRAALKLVNAKGLSIGGTFDDLFPCLFKKNGASATDLPVLSTFSGIFYDQVKGDFSYEDSLCWRVSRPFPCTITAAAQNLRTEDM